MSAMNHLLVPMLLCCQRTGRAVKLSSLMTLISPHPMLIDRSNVVMSVSQPILVGSRGGDRS